MAGRGIYVREKPYIHSMSGLQLLKLPVVRAEQHIRSFDIDNIRFCTRKRIIFIRSCSMAAPYGGAKGQLALVYIVATLFRLFCWSLEHGVVPSSMKSAYITPILKKANLDSSDLRITYKYE